MRLGILLTVSIALSTSALALELPKEEPLWPNGAPGKAVIVHKQPEKNTLMIGKTGTAGGGANFVSVPTMMLFPAPKAKATRAAVVVFPGGGYRNVVLGKEGVNIATKLNEMGITAVVVKYRTMVTADPNRASRQEWTQQLPTIVGDGLRAVQMVRSRAKELGVDPNKIGVMGFSAGSHLSASILTSPELKPENRPDFACLIYGSLWGDDLQRVKPGIAPCFLAVAENDNKVEPNGIMEFYEVLRKAKVPAELHVYQSGGHGFGIGRPGETNAMWMDEFAAWLRQNGVLPR
jgi:acetyl esterase/lipase